MRNTVSIGMACVFLSACGVDVAERVHVVDSPVDTSDGLPAEGMTVPNVIPPRLTRFEATASKTPSNEGNRVKEAQAAQGAFRRTPPSPVDEQKGPTVPGNGRASVPSVSSSPGLNTRSGATASKTPNDAGNRVQDAQAAQAASDGLPLSPADEQKSLTVPGNGRTSVPAASSSPGFSSRSGATASKTPNDAGNRVQEAQAAQGASDGLPPSPADEQKGPTVPGNGGASVPAASTSPGFKVADGTVIARDESMKVVRFLGNDLSNGACQLLTSQLTLHSNGKTVFETKIFSLLIHITYKFYLNYYDHQRNLLFTTPDLSHQVSQEDDLIDERKHEITFDMSEFEKVEHVKITFKCEREGFDNPSANASSGATALTPKGEGNQTQDASQGLSARTAGTPQPSPSEPSSRPSAPVVPASEPKLLDINTASADALNRIGERFGKAIIAGRPYRSVGELVSKRVLKRSTFSRIKDRITVNTAAQPTAAPKAPLGAVAYY
jgi:DNA uptake protein ComE-like DNA-binding protein